MSIPFHNLIALFNLEKNFISFSQNPQATLLSKDVGGGDTKGMKQTQKEEENTIIKELANYYGYVEVDFYHGKREAELKHKTKKLFSFLARIFSFSLLQNSFKLREHKTSWCNFCFVCAISPDFFCKKEEKL